MTQTIELGSILTGAVGSLILLLIGIIAFFIKKILNKIEMVVTIDMCRQNMKNCFDLRTSEKELADERRKGIVDRLSEIEKEIYRGSPR
jgi:5-bromo-4-chloroindolyl phosphate hydrolysis protein